MNDPGVVAEYTLSPKQSWNHADALRVWADHIAIDAKRFTWWYRKTQFPRFQDKGKAAVRIAHGRADRTVS